MTDVEAKPPATDADPASSNGRTSLLAALTTLVAALTLIATVNGEIARMFRNHQLATILALGLELVAILCGLLTQTGMRRPSQTVLLTIGSVALVAGMGFALFAQIRTLSLSDRPAVAATTQLDGARISVRAHAETRKAKAHDQIVVIAYGIDANDQRTGGIYYAKTGPTTAGELSQDVQLDLDPARFHGVYLSAVVVPENVRPPNVDCDGDIVNADGRYLLDANGKHVPFRPHGRAPLVACLTVQFER